MQYNSMQCNTIQYNRYTFFNWTVAAKFNELLNFDVMTLGNHEFGT